MKFSIRLLYLYLFSFVGLILVVIGTVRLVDLGMKVFVFKGSDVYEYRDIAPKPIMEGEVVDEVQYEEEQRQLAINDAKRNRQRDVSSSMAMIIVGLPLYLYHWGIIKREGKKKI